ncbi:hypothetical protein RND71_042494 [Anisodus tanguticus]|uniref:Uncharacterized protein n=1 Tax=Anisodus tanguticus TaxID=243964 RepID=A0AAE1QTI7_9SOLA|nr:hypothetical protein RND71_042494 [Anisodus tanguticus]
MVCGNHCRYMINGFPYALNVWAFEVFLAFRGFSKYKAQKLPRMLCWGPSKQHVYRRFNKYNVNAIVTTEQGRIIQLHFNLLMIQALVLPVWLCHLDYLITLLMWKAYRKKYCRDVGNVEEPIMLSYFANDHFPQFNIVKDMLLSKEYYAKIVDMIINGENIMDWDTADMLDYIKTWAINLHSHAKNKLDEGYKTPLESALP